MLESAVNGALFEARLEELEKEYEYARGDAENLRRLEELHFLISDLLGKKYLRLLQEYADRLIAEYKDIKPRGSQAASPFFMCV